MLKDIHTQETHYINAVLPDRTFYDQNSKLRIHELYVVQKRRWRHILFFRRFLSLSILFSVIPWVLNSFILDIAGQVAVPNKMTTQPEMLRTGGGGVISVVPPNAAASAVQQETSIKQSNSPPGNKLHI